MNCQLYVMQKPSGKGYNHVTFCVDCDDGFYEFGFYGLGKNNDQKLAVSVDKYAQKPLGVAEAIGKSKKSLDDLIKHARAYPDKEYNLVTNNCGDFTKYMCRHAGVNYPFGAVLK